MKPWKVLAVALSLAAGASAAEAATIGCTPPTPCVQALGEPDRRTVRQRLENPVLDRVERPARHRVEITVPDYSLLGPPILFDVQSPRAIGR
jgi:hypothetical protein